MNIGQAFWQIYSDLTANPDNFQALISLIVFSLGFYALETFVDFPKTSAKNHSKTTHPAPAMPITDNRRKGLSPTRPEEQNPHKIWRRRLKEGLSKTRASLEKNISDLLLGSKIDAKTLDSLHEILFRADIGVQTTDKLVAKIKDSLDGSQASWQEVQDVLRLSASAILEPEHSKESPKKESGPHVILVVGVNGVGKTTTIGKLASHYMSQDKTVLLCAADTYRAAAIDQLKVWGERLGTKVIAHQANSDPAAVAYDGVKAALARQADVLLIDTAGRLHSKSDLMKELDKIKRVIGKDLPTAPHETLLVLDSTTGQNAFAQVKAFSEVVELSGLVVTKLDGTAKGGVVLGLWDQFKIPVEFLGVGEGVDDLKPFMRDEFLDSLFPSS